MQRKSLQSGLQSLKKPKTLLLTGGAFGVGALAVWCGLTWTLINDRTAAAPPEAVAAVMLTGSMPEKVTEAFPADLRQALAGSGAYAVRLPDGNLSWKELAKDGRPRLIRRSAAGIGFLKADGKILPVEVSFASNGVIARVGRGFRGIDLESHRPSSGLIKALPSESLVYLRDARPQKTSAPLEAILAGSGNLLPGAWQKLWAVLPSETEFVLGSPKDEVIQPFILASRITDESRLDAVDAAIRRLVGLAYPLKKPIILPDRSGSTEIHSSEDSVKASTRAISTGLIRTFNDASGIARMLYFLDKSGDLWISNHSEIIQQFVVLQTNELSYPECVRSNDIFTSIFRPETGFYPKNIDTGITPLLKGFDLVIFSLRQAETGLFTLCGYH